MKELHKKIIDFCYQNKISHISSALNVIDTLDEIYNIKKENEPCILSCGHCGIALYAILNKYYGFSILDLYNKHGLHPGRCDSDKIYCSTGSLSCGITIASGMALADRNKNVYCVISDGECDEGATFEALRFRHEYQLNNLKIYVICNGTSAYRSIDLNYLKKVLLAINNDIIIKEVNCSDISILKGIEGHYKVLTELEYNKLIE